ncbi:MAG: asparagine synthase (glutamine-hydrolyzing), partial [Chloroflexi bacterium]|nr:asparagine synthase (glutamine-hydrolyzing) [Chloroflexota bacterium]
MCGIAGIVGGEDQIAAVTRMVQTLHHRGPDDQGIEGITAGSRRVILGSTRLAILDLSAAAHMPMVDPDTGNCIVHNGEVYDFQDLRRDLQEIGEHFHSNSDTEVLLKAYKRWGRDCVQRFRGMFAFAIWDNQQQEIFLARDRAGKKPLYYYQDSSGTFLFASEVRSLLASGIVDRRIEPAAMEVFLFNGFIVSPLTIVKGVRSLLPGQWMRVGTDGQVIETASYWSHPHYTPSKRKASDVMEEVRSKMEEAVRLRTISDVPLGAFLSGGLDSSSIVALMARAGGDVRTFSVTFEEPDFDESAFSRWVARRFNTQHTEVRLRSEDFTAGFLAALGAMDQPSFDGVNTYCVAKAAKESGLTVALSGLGGDEVFGGYPFFKTTPWLSRLAQMAYYLPSRISDTISAWPDRQSHLVAGGWKTLELLHRDGQQFAPNLSLLAAYQTAQMLFPHWMRRKLLPDGTHASRHDIWFGLPAEFVSFLQDKNGGGEQSSLSAFALRLFLGERCLRDTDAMGMGVSLEIRAPFTDHCFI